MIISERLKELRQESGLSVKSLAKILGASEPQLFRYESASSDPSSDVVIRIAKYFNVSTDYLLGISDKRGAATTPKKDPRKTALIGSRLKELRKERRMSAVELAEIIGVTRQQIVRYESEQCDITTKVLVVFADYFKVSVDYLLGRSDERK